MSAKHLDNTIAADGAISIARYEMDEAVAGDAVGSVPVDCECDRRIACRLPLQTHRVLAVLGDAQPPGRAGRRGEVHVVEHMECRAVGGVGQIAHFEIVGVIVQVVPESQPHAVGAVVEALVGHNGEAGGAVVAERLAAGMRHTVDNTHIVEVKITALSLYLCHLEGCCICGAILILAEGCPVHGAVAYRCDLPPLAILHFSLTDILPTSA